MSTWTITTARLPLPGHTAPLHLLLAVDEATRTIVTARIVDGRVDDGRVDDSAAADALTDAADRRPAPDTVVTDRSHTFGPGTALHTVCSALGIGIKPAGTLTPCSKAYTEQAMDTVLRHLSPARTRADLDTLLPHAVDTRHRPQPDTT